MYILIYCGGGGTRLWPYSRDKAPKQFLSFNGDKTLIRKTFERVKSVVPLENIYIITLPDYTDEVHKFLHEIPKDQVIVEPARRDTLLAAGLGAVLIQKKDPNAVIVNQWSDQLVEGVDKYRDALFAGAETAWTKKVLVTTGVRPEYPHPGLEYVRKGEHLSQKNGVDVYKVDKFIDFVQDRIYTGKRDLTIPITNDVQQTLRPITGELNEALKNKLPESYRNLNDRYSELVDTRNELNLKLGVEGEKGGALMKRVFSPSDANTKKLFADILDETGIDLVNEATLARYVMDVLGDARQKSMLEQLNISIGKPTAGSLTTRLIDYLIEKANSPEELIRRARLQTVSGGVSKP